MLITPEWAESIALAIKPENLYEIGSYQERPVYLDLEDPTKPKLCFLMDKETITCCIRTKLHLIQVCKRMEITVPRWETVTPEWIPGYQVADNLFAIGVLDGSVVYICLENGGVVLKYTLYGKSYSEEIKTKEGLNLKCSLLGVK